MNTMNRRTTLTLTALAFLWLGVVLPAGKAIGQQAGSTLKNQLVGTWMLVSNYTDREDGSKVDTFGPNPTGILMFDGNGHLSLQEMRSGLPKFASNNRQEGTAEENKAVVQGSICYFGTYSVNEVDHTLNFHLESCSFPNWNGTDVKRSFTLTGDELTWSGGGSSGRPVHTVWKRAK
jgi:Lipocalin-like domain